MGKGAYTDDAARRRTAFARFNTTCQRVDAPGEVENLNTKFQESIQNHPKRQDIKELRAICLGMILDKAMGGKDIHYALVKAVFQKYKALDDRRFFDSTLKIGKADLAQRLASSLTDFQLVDLIKDITGQAPKDSDRDKALRDFLGRPPVAPGK